MLIAMVVSSSWNGGLNVLTGLREIAKPFGGVTARSRWNGHGRRFGRWKKFFSDLRVFGRRRTESEDAGERGSTASSGVGAGGVAE
jgi:hypothetical protein